MFRLRRYRVFIIFAIIAVGLLYQFSYSKGLDALPSPGSVEQLKKSSTSSDSKPFPPLQDQADHKGSSAAKEEKEEKEENGHTSDTPSTKIGTGHHDAVTPDEPAKEASASPLASSSSTSIDKDVEDRFKNEVSVLNPASDETNPKGHGKPESRPTPTKPKNNTRVDDGKNKSDKDEEDEDRASARSAASIKKIYWTPLPEHFPIPSENILQFPTGKPKSIPKIQHNFKEDSDIEKQGQKEKLDEIREYFMHSWTGYREKAWMHDELRPESGDFHDPFCGWGATLVDSLDTLWILGLKEEFENAVDAVKGIDFTTSKRNDIPLFETVIRYLGGLLGAYDISNGAYKILLDKAVELAEILMGAFDTPNRMPVTFYLWKPAFMSQPHRARTRVVLAELGSLSVEFTRLAQITKEAKYYDAVARITNELEIMQSTTKVPGLWPESVDLSGCNKNQKPTLPYGSKGPKGRPSKEKPLGHIDNTDSTADNTKDTKPAEHDEFEDRHDKLAQFSKQDNDEEIEDDESDLDKDTSPENGSSTNRKAATHSSAQGSERLKKREASTTDPSKRTEAGESSLPECEPQGLASPPYSSSEKFLIGAPADSTYEYLPKQYLLLGGLEDKYRFMYEYAADVTTEKLLFRPMLKDEKRSILGAGILLTDGEAGEEEDSFFTPEGAHLTCFAGGMYAMGSRIFNRPDDMDRAKKLTDGCVWAYESTKTGLMPESFRFVPCLDMKNCPWNETLWKETLDPFWRDREKDRLAQEARKASKAKAKAEAKVKAEAKAKAKAEAKAKSADEEERGYVSKPSTSNDEDDNTPTSKPSSSKPKDDVIKPSLSGKAPAPTATTLGKDSSSQKATVKESDEKDPEKLLKKRQLGDLGDSASTKEVEPVKENDEEDETDVSKKSGSQSHLADSAEETDDEPTSTTDSVDEEEYELPPILTHDEFVANKMKNEKLIYGISTIGERKYILRPEAIESVFIMYRVTGDDYWREKGWKMYKAVEQATKTTYGSSAIYDVQAEEVRVMDQMESFWLAETLKYYYLLFSDTDLVSLDDYILNTEAHPFKRPK